MLFSYHLFFEIIYQKGPISLRARGIWEKNLQYLETVLYQTWWKNNVLRTYGLDFDFLLGNPTHIVRPVEFTLYFTSKKQGVELRETQLPPGSSHIE